MKKSVKIWLIIASVLTVVGACIFAVSMSAIGWDFSALSTENYITNVHTVDESFETIYLETDTADVTVKLSNDDSCRVECFESEKQIHTVEVIDGRLYVRSNDQRKWYEYIGFSFNQTKITVYLNQADYEKLSVKCSTGDLSVENGLSFDSIDARTSTGNIQCNACVASDIRLCTSTGSISLAGTSMGSLEISVSTGNVSIKNTSCTGNIDIEGTTSRISLRDVVCNSLEISSETGDVVLKNTVAQNCFDIETDTGDVIFRVCDAEEINVETDTGDVFGSLLSEKVFICKSDTGNIRVPESTSGGICKITTDTGDIKISFEQ